MQVNDCNSYLLPAEFDCLQVKKTLIDMCKIVDFIPNRGRHTSCALVTGVQTCALPISDKWTSRKSAAAVTCDSAEPNFVLRYKKRESKHVCIEPDEIGRAARRERVCK